MQGYHLAFFWNSFLPINWFGHLSVFLFLKKSYLFRLILSIFQHNIQHFTKFQNLFNILWQIFFENLAFFTFEDLPICGQMWPFYFWYQATLLKCVCQCVFVWVCVNERGRKRDTRKWRVRECSCVSVSDGPNVSCA